jgi:metal-responsive CopG/Arc/MetJ family transcriptional regulator
MSYTKTAISIPQDVFECGEKVAAELGISRSELYARALRAMLRERKIEAARIRLNEALGRDQANAGRTQVVQEMHGIASATIHRATERGESTW